jgi:hypothetical protein
VRLLSWCSLLFVLASGVLFGAPPTSVVRSEAAVPVAILLLHGGEAGFDVTPVHPVDPQQDVQVAAVEPPSDGIDDEDDASGGDGETTGEPGATSVRRPANGRAPPAPKTFMRELSGHPRGREHPPRA